MTDDRIPWWPPGLDDLVLIGRGGSGAVYRAREVSFDRLVAVKILDGEESSAAVSGVGRRFERECELVGRLTGHPNVVTPLSSGITDDGSMYLVMELCTGGSLADRISAGGFTADGAIPIARQLVAALISAHRRGVIHCDVKPRNVVFRWNGAPALTDFGVARISGSTGSTGSTATVLALTPLHAAPELLRGAAPTAASDCYSLGSTIHTMLSGSAPFARGSGDTPYAVLDRVLSEPAPRLEVDENELATLVQEMLNKSPSDRPRPVDVLARLDHIAVDIGLEPAPVTVMEGGDYLDVDPTDEHDAVVVTPIAVETAPDRAPPRPSPTRSRRFEVPGGVGAMVLIAVMSVVVISVAVLWANRDSRAAESASPVTVPDSSSTTVARSPFELVQSGISRGSTSFPAGENTSAELASVVRAAEPDLRSVSTAAETMQFSEVSDPVRFPKVPIEFTEGFVNSTIADGCGAFTSNPLRIDGITGTVGVSADLVVLVTIFRFSTTAQALEFHAGRSIELGVTKAECSGITSDALIGPDGVTTDHRSVPVPESESVATAVNSWRTWNWESFNASMRSTSSIVAVCGQHVVQLAVGTLAGDPVPDDRFDLLGAGVLSRVPGGCDRSG